MLVALVLLGACSKDKNIDEPANGKCKKRSAVMKREIIRVEPLSSYLENWKAPTSSGSVRTSGTCVSRWRSPVR